MITLFLFTTLERKEIKILSLSFVPENKISERKIVEKNFILFFEYLSLQI